MRQYEAMFLFDPTFGASLEKCEAEIRRMMDRAEAEVLFCRKWDERRLAYRIKGRKRGVYILVYFKAPPHNIAGIHRDAQLSEGTLRLLILGADGVTPEMMERAAAVPGAEMPARATIDPVQAKAQETPADTESTAADSAPEAVGEAKPEVDVPTETAVAEEPVEEPAEGPVEEPAKPPMEEPSGTADASDV